VTNDVITLITGLNNRISLLLCTSIAFDFLIRNYSPCCCCWGDIFLKARAQSFQSPVSDLQYIRTCVFNQPIFQLFWEVA